MSPPLNKPLTDRVTHLEAVLPRIEALVEKAATQMVEASKLVAETNQIARTALERTNQIAEMQLQNATAAAQLTQARADVGDLKREIADVRKSVEGLARKGVYLATMITVLGAVGSYLLNSVSFYPKNPPPVVEKRVSD